MPVYVDSERIPYRGMRMSHMVGDSLEELHEMAEKVGLRTRWFQHSWIGIPHYDVCDSVRKRVIFMGAIPVTRAEMVGFIQRFKKEHNLDKPISNHPSREHP